MSYGDFIVTFGDYNGLNDITDRVYGLQTSITCNVGALNMASAVLTINNNDGAFTPGIGGTYSSVDLFSQAVFISKGSTAYPVFHGIVDQVIFADDGTNSTVQIQCVDGLTVGGRSPNGYSIGTYYTATDVDMLQDIYNGYTNPVTAVTVFDPAGLPTLDGGLTPEVIVTLLGDDADYPFFWLASEGIGTSSVKDVVNNQMMPSFLGVAWPGTIDLNAASATYFANLVHSLTRDDVTTYSFGGSGIPIETLQTGFRTELLYNSASAEQSYGSSGTSSSADSASVDKYGSRAISMSGMLGWFADFDTDQEFAKDYFTQNYANRFSTVRYSPVRMTILLEAAEEAGIAEATVHSLMSINDGLWNLAEITYRPAGAVADVTDVSVIAGLTISAVPGRTTIALELLPAADYQSFVLDSDVLGVLDQNRLG